jgi:hypothetical protein
MKSVPIQAEHRNGNLHVKICGDFDAAAAHTATSLINDQYPGCGNVFVNTEKMGAVLEGGAKAFRDNMSDGAVHLGKLFLVGEKGREIGPDGSRVIIPPPKKDKCTGCGKCNCGLKKSKGGVA